MDYIKLAGRFYNIERMSGRLEMTDELISLISETPGEDLEKVIRLIQGQIRPGYEGVEIGVAEKLAVKALYQVTMISESEIDRIRKETGDIGKTAESIIRKKKQTSLFSTPLTVERVFNNLDRIASREGKSSQDTKLKIIAEMLHDSSPVEARYITRTVCSKMRIGTADMTIIDAFAYSFSDGFDDAVSRLDELDLNDDIKKKVRDLGSRKTAPLYDLIEILSKPTKLDMDREIVRAASDILKELKDRIQLNREKIVRANNIHPDLAFIGNLIAESGIDRIEEINITPGIPLRSMLGERLRSVEDILEKLGGRCAFEYKYDGLRVQAHVVNENGGNRVRLFSRQLEDITGQFPDVVENLKRSFKGNDCIVEGECVPVDPNTLELLPFQVISQRRGRKYDLDEAVRSVPVSLILFDCLYADGIDMTGMGYLKRRDMIESVLPTISGEITMDPGISISTMSIVGDPEEGEDFFLRSLDDGCEGIMAKSIDDSSVYKAGNRGWMWIKYKKDYRSELTDSLDLVAVGGFHGSGRRGGSIGALLMAVYDDKENVYRTVCKLGSGFTDDHLSEFGEIFGDLKVPARNPRVDTKMEPDMYFEPRIVLEVIAAEISFSPVHTCGWDSMKDGAGLALRFPRFTGRIRDDKGPEQATTVQEIIDMYKSQRKTA